jgi:hypothetical protein
MFPKKIQARQRHQRLMRAAHRLLANAAVLGTDNYDNVTPDHLISLVFGRYGLDTDSDEAQRYLSAARVSRGLNPLTGTHQLTA